MAQLELVFSREFDSGFAETVKAELGAYLEITGPYFSFEKAAEPSLGPPLIQLIGDAAAWLPLGAAATVYLTTLAKRAAGATWDGLASLLISKEVKPLADVATTLADVVQEAESDVEIVVGLDPAFPK